MAIATIALARGEAATVAVGAGQDVIVRGKAVSNHELRRAAPEFS